MKICACYEVIKRRQYTYHPNTGQPVGHDVNESICNGTQEKDLCSCGGDETKCDFYPEVREKAKIELEKNMTNRDFLFSITDNERLAEYLVDIGWDCHLCSEHERLDNEPLLRGEGCDEQCVRHCSEWLRQRVKG